MLPDLVAFVAVLVVCLLGFAALMAVLWGPALPQLDSAAGAVTWAIGYFMNGAGVGEAEQVVQAVMDVSAGRGGCVRLGWGQGAKGRRERGGAGIPSKRQLSPKALP